MRQSKFLLFYFNYWIWLQILLLLVSCQDSKFDDEFLPGHSSDTVTKTVSWDFSNSSDYSCESGSCSSGKNIVVLSGKASLQVVDTEHSGSDFSSGSHVGSEYSSSKINMLTEPSTSSTHVNTILPSKSSSLVGYWRFDGDYNDSSSKNHNGTVNGNTALSTDSYKVGTGATSFDGNTDYISVADSTDFEPDSALAISVWIKPSFESGKVHFIVGNRDGFGGWMLRWESSNKFSFFVYNGTALTSNTYASYDSLNNQWHHLAVIYTESGTQKILLDGLDITSTTSNRTFNLGGELTISSNSNPSFNGSIDELAIYNTTLAESDILSIYSAQNASYTELSSDWTPHYSDLVGYWKMDGNWQDSSGNGNSGTANGDATFTSNSKVGSQAGSFDGSGDYISISTTMASTIKSDTISSWVYSEGPGSSTAAVTVFGIMPSVNDFETLAIYTTDTNQTNIRCKVLTDQGGLSPTGFALPQNTWHHITCVHSYDSSTNTSTLSLYVNGHLNSQSSQTSVTAYANSSNRYHIGLQKNSTDRYFKGRVDEAAHWTIALSSSDIATIYNRQKQKYAASYKSSVIDMGTAQSLTSLATTTELPFAKELTTSSESSSDYSSLNASSDLSNGLVGYWPLDESSENGVGGSDFEDKSVNSNNVDIVSGVTVGQLGILGNSIKIDGVDGSGVNLGNNYDIRTGDQSISTWVKSSHTSSNQIIFSTLNGNCNNPQTGLSILTNGRARACIRETSGSFSVTSTISNLNDGNWHHIVSIFDRDGYMSLYIDGEKDSSTTDISSLNGIDIYAGTSFRIGSQSDGEEAFNGNIDEFAIWSRTLSDTEIQELYRRGANRVKYQLRTCSDSTCSTDPEWKGIGGDGTTYFSEIYNRVNTDLNTIFSGCDSSGDSICSNTEFSLSGDTQASSLSTLFSDTPFSSLSSRYWQYRVLMEAEDNTSCSSSVCLPTVSGITFSPTGYYYAGTPEIKSSNSIYVPKTPSSLEESKSGSCTITYQFSTDGSNYKYWNGSSWVSVSSNSDANTASSVSTQLASLTTYPSSLYFKAFMASDGYQSCELDQLSVRYVQ